MNYTVLGEGPDLIETSSDWLTQVYPKDLVAEINLGDKARDFEPVALQSFTHEGKLFGVPYNVLAVALYYNKDPVPTPPKTWDELKSIAQKLQAEKKVRQGFAFMSVGDAYDTYPLLSGFGGYSFGRDKNGSYDLTQVGLDSPGGIQATLELDSMIKARLLRNDIDYGTAQDMFRQGQLAMWVSGPWTLNYVGADTRYGVALIPPMTQAARSLVNADGVVLNRLSKNGPLAQLFLTEFLVRTDVMRTFYKAKCLIPAYLPVLREIEDPDIVVFQAAAADGDLMPGLPALRTYWDNGGGAITVIYQQKDLPKNVIKSAANAMRKQIAGLGK